MKEEQIEKEISSLIFDNLDHIYCDNCKFSGLKEDESKEKYDYWGCDDCHRKMMGWELSKSEADRMAKSILVLLKLKEDNG